MAKMKWKTVEEIEAEKKRQEYLASLPSEIEQLKAKLAASSQQNDFLEEVIVEMAMIVYAEG